MNELIVAIGGASVVLALFLDSISYWKQIAKTLRTKRSSQVSSSQFLYKIAKAVCACIGLAIYHNWVGVGIEMFMIMVYTISLYIVARYKPKGWTLFGRRPKLNTRSTTKRSVKTRKATITKVKKPIKPKTRHQP